MVSIPDPSGATLPDEVSERRARRISPVGSQLSDAGNGERLAARHHKRIRYVTDLGKWLVWDDLAQVWQYDDDLARMRSLAVETARHLAVETVAGGGGADTRAKIAVHAIKSENLERINAAIKLAQSSELVRIESRELDPDPYLFGAADCTIDLRTGKSRKPDPADLITRQSPITYDPKAKAPRFLAFLAQVQPDPEMQEFMHRLLGYFITGLTREQTTYFFYGTGENGKSKLAEIVIEAMGTYAQIAGGDLLLASNTEASSGAPHPELLRMRGIRFTKCLETDEGRRLNESIMKQLTGEDKVAARGLYTNTSVEFMPVVKIITATNHLPRLRGQDRGLKRRIKVVPFTQTFSKDDGTANVDLMSELMAELPGILAWLVQGAKKYIAKGITYPEAVKRATFGYFEENDPIGKFLAEQCVTVDPEFLTYSRVAETPATPIFNAYETWAQANGYRSVHILNSTAFGIKLKDRGLIAHKRGTVHRVGVRLREYQDENGQEYDLGELAESGKLCRVCLLPYQSGDHSIHPDCDDMAMLPIDGPDPVEAVTAALDAEPVES